MMYWLLIEHTPVRGDSLALYSLYCIRSNKTQESRSIWLSNCLWYGDMTGHKSLRLNKVTSSYKTRNSPVIQSEDQVQQPVWVHH